jgi:hypothetical protein
MPADAIVYFEAAGIVTLCVTVKVKLSTTASILYEQPSTTNKSPTLAFVKNVVLVPVTVVLAVAVIVPAFGIW